MKPDLEVVHFVWAVAVPLELSSKIARCEVGETFMANLHQSIYYS